MKFIDKYLYAKEAHAVNVRYLQDCFQGAGQPMLPPVDNPDRSFEDFKKPQYRICDNGQLGWQDLLILEQDCRCCYCMRRIERHKMNVEHVVPKSLSGKRGQQEYNNYAKYAPALRDFVMMSDQFASKNFVFATDIEKEQKMPHITAIANLLAACNGKRGEPNTGCCCNNTRQDSFIIPLMLMPDCDRRVDYDENGIFSVLPIEESLLEISNELNDETYSQVRQIWYKISGTSFTMAEIKAMDGFLDRVRLFKTAFGVEDFEKLPDSIKKFAGSTIPQRDFYWDLLLSYDWFYDYYQDRRKKH